MHAFPGNQIGRNYRKKLLFQTCDYYSNLCININKEGADVSKLCLIRSQIRTLCFCGKPQRANQIVWSLTADINNRFSSRFPPDLSSTLSVRHWIINLIMLISLVKMLCNGLIKSCSPGDPTSEKDEGISVDPWLCDWWMLVASWRLVNISCPRVVRSQFLQISSSHTQTRSCLFAPD